MYDNYAKLYALLKCHLQIPRNLCQELRCEFALDGKT